MTASTLPVGASTYSAVDVFTMGGVLLLAFVLVFLPVILLADALYQRLTPTLAGPEADWREPLRAYLWPRLDTLMRRYLGPDYYATAELEAAGYALTFHDSPEGAEAWLWDNGYTRNAVAAFKTTPDHRPSVGSWARREWTRPALVRLRDAAQRVPLLARAVALVQAITATRQVHVTLFEGDGERTHIYAHEEFNSLNPRTMRRHYRGVSHSETVGVDEIVSLAWRTLDKSHYSRAALEEWRAATMHDHE